MFYSCYITNWPTNNLFSYLLQESKYIQADLGGLTVILGN